MGEMESESVDCIVTDPPFNTGKKWKGRTGEFYDTFPVDEDELHFLRGDIRAFLEAWRDVDESVIGYLTYMAPRLEEIHRVLKPTGSLFLQCDEHASHHLKLLLDAVFGRKNFVNEIIWCYGGRGIRKDRFQNKHGTIFFYAKDNKQRYFDKEGASRKVEEKYAGRYNKVDEKGNRYARVKNKDGSYGNYYLKKVVREDWWQIPFVRGEEVVGYPTQKPLELCARMIKAATKESDVVFDPFCGSGTTCVAAKCLGRDYLGVDLSEDAVTMAEDRLADWVDTGIRLGDSWVITKEMG